jgi:hypothetical protein
MPVHDWSRVSAGTFHDFHTSWITHIKEALNGGLLPKGLYALAEQTATRMRPDVLTLSRNRRSDSISDDGGVAVLAPKTTLSRKADRNAAYRLARRTIVIRHSSGHEVVALLEIASPANKDRAASVEDFVDKLKLAIAGGVHVLLVDLIPPGPYDPLGLHGAFWQLYDNEVDPDWPPDKPLVLASYEARDFPEAWIEPVAVGQTLPDMPLFYDKGRYVNVPFEATYQQAWRGVPDVWKDVIEGRASANEL